MSRRAHAVIAGAFALGLAATALTAGQPRGLPATVRGVRVADPSCPTGFSRDRFGAGITPQVRSYVLRFNPSPAPAGQVWDAYADRWIETGQADIDHVRSLHSMWCAGAAALGADAREVLGRDTGNMFPTLASTNRSKGDRDPDTWTPPAASAGCAYGWRWLTTTRTWGLTATRAQLLAVARLIDSCP